LSYGSARILPDHREDDWRAFVRDWINELFGADRPGSKYDVFRFKDRKPGEKGLNIVSSWKTSKLNMTAKVVS